VNRGKDRIFNLPAYADIRDIQGTVDLAVIAVPAEGVEEAIRVCGEKGVRGVSVITAGFAETYADGDREQARLAHLARSLGMRLLGPNISGTFNLHAAFNTTPEHVDKLFKTPVGAISQGGFAFKDINAAGRHRHMGVGKFVHTGNEADLTITDFLELYGADAEVQAIAMYIEAIRDGRRFVETARRVTRTKPIVVYKGARSADSARAAKSHTGALSSDWQIYQGMFRQTGISVAPSMELLLPLAHGLIERPPMRGNRVAIITMGGSWGVALVDCLADYGLRAPEFSDALQQRLRGLGLSDRASARNPLDYGASGRFLDTPFMVSLCREILVSGEVDAMVVHGFGREGMKDEADRKGADMFHEAQLNQLLNVSDLEADVGRPVLIASHHSPWESQTIHDINRKGIRVYNRLSDIGVLLSRLRDYWAAK
jgi:acyl-CoA synthetase (NDP forming)